MPFYPDRINEHFLNPLNVGEIADAEAVGEASSFQCGARLRLSLNIDDELKIVDARFKATGCGYLVASASALTETLKELRVGRAALPGSSAQRLAELSQLDARRVDRRRSFNLHLLWRL